MRCMYILSNSSLNFENRITDDTKCVSTSTVIINLLESFKLFDCIQAFLAPASFFLFVGGGGGWVGGRLKFLLLNGSEILIVI